MDVGPITNDEKDDKWEMATLNRYMHTHLPTRQTVNKTNAAMKYGRTRNATGDGAP